ncbi:MAG: hypothetical protein HY340_04170 [Candidatus Kerfeldbacteria bacterium]|nr:hypothetical protein [Candidatus Kerfeldbacteria bacterium]
MAQIEVICPNCDNSGFYGLMCSNCGHYLVNVTPIPVVALTGKRDSGATCSHCGATGTPGRPCGQCGHLVPIAGPVPDAPHPFQKPEGRVYQRFRCERCGTIHHDRPRTCACGSDDLRPVLLEPDEVCAKTGVHECVCKYCGVTLTSQPAVR